MPRAKKVTEKNPATIVVTPGENNPDIQAEAAVVVETPTELIPIVEASNLPDVQKTIHLSTFVPLYNNVVDLENELAEVGNDPVKAKTLRVKYRDQRKKAEELKKIAKADLLEEGRFIDKVFNVLDAACKVKEDELDVVEKAEETRKENERKALKDTRKATLDALDYDTEFLTLEDMPEESFNRLVQKATEIKEGAAFVAKQKAEREQKEREEKDAELAIQRRFQSRLSNLAAFGITAEEIDRNDDPDDIRGMSDEAFAKYIEPMETALQDKQAHEKKVRARISLLGGISYTYEDVSRNFVNPNFDPIDVDIVEFGDDAAFTKVYNARKAKYDEAEELKAEELRIAKEAETRITNRITAVGRLGLTFDAATQLYTGFGQKFSLEDIKSLEAQEFKDELDRVKGLVDAQKKKDAEEQKKKDAELKKLQDESAKRKADLLEQKEKERLANLAPDVDKLRVLYADIKAIKIPELTTEDMKAFVNQVAEGLKLITTNISKKAREAK